MADTEQTHGLEDEDNARQVQGKHMAEMARGQGDTWRTLCSAKPCPACFRLVSTCARSAMAAPPNLVRRPTHGGQGLKARPNQTHGGKGMGTWLEHTAASLFFP